MAKNISAFMAASVVYFTSCEQQKPCPSNESPGLSARRGMGGYPYPFYARLTSPRASQLASEWGCHHGAQVCRSGDCGAHVDTQGAETRNPRRHGSHVDTGGAETRSPRRHGINVDTWRSAVRVGVVRVGVVRVALVRVGTVRVGAVRVPVVRVGAVGIRSANVFQGSQVLSVGAGGGAPEVTSLRVLRRGASRA